MIKLNKNQKLKSVSIVFFVSISILLGFYILNKFNVIELKGPSHYFSNHYALGWTEFNVKGIIVKKYVDSDNHQNPTIIVTDTTGNDLFFNFQTNDTVFYNFVLVGDSVSSGAESYSAKVWNINKEKVFNFE